MTVFVNKTIDTKSVELAIYKPEELTSCFGVALRHEHTRTHQPYWCKHIDTGQEYEDYLSKQGVLLEEPES